MTLCVANNYLAIQWLGNGEVSVSSRTNGAGSDAYGPDPILRQPPREIELPAAGRRAKNFVVLSPSPAPPGARWGTVTDVKTGKAVNLRQHAYVILPMEKGFYVIIYPATRDGFKLYEPEFNALVNSFEPIQEGPDGPRVSSAKPAAANIFK